MNGLPDEAREDLNRLGQEIEEAIPGAPHEWYDQHGNPIGMGDWGDLRDRRKDDMGPDSWWRRISKVGDAEISTAWIGLDLGFRFTDDEPPLIWETMIFGGEHDEACFRYPNRQIALDDHERICRDLRAGRDPGG